jgi:Fic-DOC domain mobile mystery protein B
VVVGATDPLVPDADGSTPLAPDELSQLRPSWVRTRGDLNRAEAEAIAATQRHFARRVPLLEVILDDLWLRRLHERMFGAVWGWAGNYRCTERNIGVGPNRIAVDVRNLTADAVWWFRGDAPAEEAAARFHHRLVLIHPFPNGNGRHARMASDLCLRSLGRPQLTWGRTLQLPVDEVRGRYISALRAADAGDLGPLVAFVTT